MAIQIAAFHPRVLLFAPKLPTRTGEVTYVQERARSHGRIGSVCQNRQARSADREGDEDEGDGSACISAKKKKCNLIIMGSHGRSGVVGILLGSVTQKVLNHLTIPVLVLR
jgi:nucleotide-binding universal stress UspA family protein